MKILFVLPNVAVGGVERVRLTLIRQLIEEGIDCRLALRHARGELIEQARTLVPIDELAPRGIHQFVPELARLIREKKPTHLVTAFSDVGLLTWIALRLAKSDAKWVHSADNTHAAIAFRPKLYGRIRSRLENRAAAFVYRRADATVAVSDGVREEIIRGYQIDPLRVTTIYNPAVPDALLMPHRLSKPADRLEPYKIIAVGRLVRQKGFDILIQAMTRVTGSWILDIWGDGPERENLEAAILHCGLQKKIRMRGYTSDPYSKMQKSDLFVLSSRHEGLGNTIAEAMAFGCQIVATDCPHGPREILKEGLLGTLIPTEDPISLASAIVSTMSGEAYVEPSLLFDRARDFSWSASCSQWLQLLTGLHG